MTAPLRPLFRDLEVRGRCADGLTEAFCERLGRGLGTLARRRGLEAATFVLGRDHGEGPARLRDGLSRGLVLSGQRVLDVGLGDARRHEFALVHLRGEGGVYVTGPDERDPSSAGLEIFLGGAPLVGPALWALAEVLRGGDFAAGAGSFAVVEIQAAFRAAERTGKLPGLGRDTQVI
jgi:phosphomannomutase / phosphoglucomutase